MFFFSISSLLQSKVNGMAVNDSDIDEIAEVFRDPDTLAEYLGEDEDEDDRGPQARTNRKSL